jgi:hypothetical protein
VVVTVASGAVAKGVSTKISASATKSSSGAAKNATPTLKVPKPVGTPYNPNGPMYQVGIDPNTLKVNSHAIFNAKYNNALTNIRTGGMYGYIEVFRDRSVISGNHRTLIGQQYGVPVDVLRR